MPIEKDNLKKAYRRAIAAENRMLIANKKAMSKLQKNIKKTSGKGTYKYNKGLDKQIKKTVDVLKKDSLSIMKDLDDNIQSLAASTIVDASRINISLNKSREIVKNISTDIFSQALRPSFNEYKKDLLRHLKISIGKGNSVESLANGLLKIDPIKTDIPAYIKNIADAAKSAIRDPKDFSTFQKVLNKHQKYIDDLTRAGETGFERLGVRRAGRTFVKEIKGAVDENTIDNIVNNWAAKKAKYIQQRVARTETSKAYHEYLNEYGFQADHIKGVEVRLSTSHPESDICDELAGIYLYATHGRDIPIPPHHPNCICHIIYLFYQDFLNNPEEFIEAA